MKKLCSHITLSIAILITPLIAKAKTGETLLKECEPIVSMSDEGGTFKNTKQAISSVSCLSYIEGFIGGLDMSNAMDKSHKKLVCIPKEEINAAQEVKIITTWQKNNPAELIRNADNNIWMALVQAFPCK